MNLSNLTILEGNEIIIPLKYFSVNPKTINIKITGVLTEIEDVAERVASEFGKIIHRRQEIFIGVNNDKAGNNRSNKK